MEPMGLINGGRACTARRRWWNDVPRLLASCLALAGLLAGCGLSPAPTAGSSGNSTAPSSSRTTAGCAQAAVTANWDGQSATLTGCAVTFGQIQVQPAVLRAGDHIQVVTHVGNLSLPSFQSTDGAVLAPVPVTNPAAAGQPGPVAEFVARDPGWANVQASWQTCKPGTPAAGQSGQPSTCPPPQVVIGVEVLPAAPGGG